MRSPESTPLFPTGEQYTYLYCPVKLPHPIAGTAYGIRGDRTDPQGRPAGCFLVPDISCDYFLVSRLAANCNAKQLDPEQLLRLLGTLPF